MREIKFRAFDKENKRMRYWDTLRLENYFIDGMYGIIKIFQLGENLSYTSETDLIPMQYTGFINSSRNQDVYEGDIVRVTEFDFENGLNTTDLHGRIGVVDFFNGSFCINIGRCIYPLNRFSFPMMIERLLVDIVGNIYENPEIMEIK